MLPQSRCHPGQWHSQLISPWSELGTVLARASLTYCNGLRNWGMGLNGHARVGFKGPHSSSVCKYVPTFTVLGSSFRAQK